VNTAPSSSGQTIEKQVENHRCSQYNNHKTDLPSVDKDTPGKEKLTLDTCTKLLSDIRAAIKEFPPCISSGNTQRTYQNACLLETPELRAARYTQRAHLNSCSFKAAALHTARYNIFDILGITEKEVLMCRYLADLLNPEGRHGCGILFLQSFFRDILKVTDANDLLLTHTDVDREYVIDNDRRIDLVIRNSRFFIPVEVKIHADEQEGQCYDYAQYARNAPLIYLTRKGDAPSLYSRKEKGGTAILSPDRILCVSWERDIYHWLERLLEHIREPIQSDVIQYMDAIRMTEAERGRKIMEKTLDLLYQSPDYFHAGIEIERSMKTAKVRLIRMVFDDFKQEMARILPKYGLEPETESLYYSYEEKTHEKFYDCYSTYPGLNYVVRHVRFQKENLNLWFRIEVEHNLFAGFALFDTKTHWQVNEITQELMDEAARYLVRDIITPSDWWLAWCYPNGRRKVDSYDDVPDFKLMNPRAVSLVDPQVRRTFVVNAVKKFEEELLRYLLTE
jgi:hypothetical protein